MSPPLSGPPAAATRARPRWRALLIIACVVVAMLSTVDGPPRGRWRVQETSSAHGPAHPPFLLEADLETGDLSQFDHVETKNGDLRVVTSPVRAGVHAAQAVVRGDRRSDGPTFRAEAVRRSAGGPHHERERWFSFSSYLPEDWTIVPMRGSDVLFQIHERPDDCETWRSPPLVLRVVGAAFRWEVRWDPRPCTRDGNRVEGPLVIASTPLLRGRWVDWVVSARWSYGPDGVVEVWQGGHKLVTHRGPNAYNDQQPLYLKIGVYHSGGDWPRGLHQRTAYFDEVRMAGPGASYETIAPGR